MSAAIIIGAIVGVILSAAYLALNEWLDRQITRDQDADYYDALEAMNSDPHIMSLKAQLEDARSKHRATAGLKRKLRDYTHGRLA